MVPRIKQFEKEQFLLAPIMSETLYWALQSFFFFFL